jgi:hypothetical protein
MLSQGTEAEYKPFKKVPLAALLSKGPMIPRFQEIKEAGERARKLNERLLLRSMYCVDEGEHLVVEKLPHYVMISPKHSKNKIVYYGPADYDLQRCAIAEILFISNEPMGRREVLPEVRTRFPQLEHYSFSVAAQNIFRDWKKNRILLGNKNDGFILNPEFREKNVWDHWSETH